MSLINCPECNNLISNKALSCPKCGYPLSIYDEALKNEKSLFEQKEELEFPDYLNEDLNIGKQIINWWGNAYIEGFYEFSENDFTDISSGKVGITLHTHGIKITHAIIKKYFIHNKQIISVIIANREMLSEIDSKFEGTAFKNDPLSVINFFYLVIEFWDIKSKKAKSLFVSCKEPQKIIAFLKRHDKERMKNINRI